MYANRLPAQDSFSDVDDVSQSLFESLSSEDVNTENSNRARTRLVFVDKSEVAKVAKVSKPAKLAEGPTTRPDMQAGFGWLEIVKGPGKGRRFPLNKRENCIGRGSKQDISLAFGDARVSRERHVMVMCDEATDTITVVDGGKTNPVHLNGKVLSGVQFLDNADQIAVGNTILIYVAPGFEGPASAGYTGGQSQIAASVRQFGKTCLSVFRRTPSIESPVGS